MEKENKIIVAYHGTSKENHDKILKSGYFKKGTWFAFDKKDAIHYGGLFVFKCYFNKDEFLKAIINYQQRERRFGKTSKQIKS